MTRRKGIMLCYPFEEKRLNKWKPPYIVQPKLDGERSRSVPLPNNQHFLLTSEENIFYSVPHINFTLKQLNLTNIELDGELYHPNLSFEQIHSIVSRTENLHPDYEQMRYYVFDIVDENSPTYDRIGRLADLKVKHPIYKVPCEICYSLEDIMKVYDKFIASGFEGIIVRHWNAPYVRKRSVGMMKFKPKKSDTYEIVGYKEEISKDGIRKGRLGALTLAGNDGTHFSVGSGLRDEDREFLWERQDSLIGRKCRISYQHLTEGKKVPRFPVFLEVV